MADSISAAQAVSQWLAALGVSSPAIGAALTRAGTMEPFEGGALIFERGDPSDALYVVVTGAVDIETTEPIARIVVGECFGEFSLLSPPTDGSAPVRTAAARARGATRLLKVPGAVVARALELEPAFRVALDALVDTRLAPLRAQLTGVFGALDEATVMELQAVAETVRLQGGEVLMRPGDAADALYIVRAGRLAVERVDSAGETVRIAELTAGQPVGESGLLTGAPRAALVRAVRDAIVIRLPHGAVERILAEHPGAALPMLRTMATRVQRQAAPPAPPPRVVTVVAERGDLSDLQAALDSEFARKTLWMDATRFEKIHGPGASESAPAARIIRWLVDQERLYDRVIFCTDGADSPWTRRCLRQSERVIRVVDADAPPSAWQVPAREADLLILLHPGDREHPRGVALWLDQHPGTRHLHLRRGHAGDAGRVGRFIAGRPLGVVLGGGGARGFAHIGALLALRDLGIEADLICGASIGAILAGIYAIEGDLHATAEATVRSGQRLRRSLTVPIASMLNTDRLDRELEAATRALNVEETWRPYFALSTNLTEYTMHLFERGPLWRAVRASCALPGILPPSVADGNVLVDGGLLDNLPVSHMRARCPGPVIAIDVGVGKGLSADTALTRIPSGGRLLWRRLWPFSRRVHAPTLVATVTHSLVCSSVLARRRGARDADLLLRPDVQGFNLMDFGRHVELIDAGRACVRDERSTLERLTG